MGRRRQRKLLSSLGAVDKTPDSNICSTRPQEFVGRDRLDEHMTQLCCADLQRDGGPAGSADQSWACSTCGFSLWIPVAKLNVSRVGLYDDARFSGRLIVSLNEHFEHYDEADPQVLSAFMSDLQHASRVLRKAFNVDRVNIAMLGNKDPHLHAHVIPRRVTDDNYGVSPWENAPAYSKLAPTDQAIIIDLLKQGFDELCNDALNRHC
jgi:diadenosine tetraphosphate (Ap4A) HIT family hydrolase